MQRFPFGRLAMTAGVSAAVEEGRIHAALLNRLLERHAAGDWGELDPEDRAHNDRALLDGERLLSAYETAAGKVYVITEWDRSHTTVLFPDEY
jgi:hypothetical protein